MQRLKVPKRVQVDESPTEIPKYDVAEDEEGNPSEALGRQNDNGEDNGGIRNSNVTEDQEPFMGVKVRRKASFRREYKGDYIDVRSNPYLMKILQKQGLAFHNVFNFAICSVNQTSIFHFAFFLGIELEVLVRKIDVWLCKDNVALVIILI